MLSICCTEIILDPSHGGNLFNVRFLCTWLSWSGMRTGPSRMGKEEFRYLDDFLRTDGRIEQGLVCSNEGVALVCHGLCLGEKVLLIIYFKEVSFGGSSVQDA
ncbi:hypothetical protein XENORESO_003107 [Xenotaenia resolanae]|uniref:Uncharacterized protein n=1 Tax=Xenotaenia resolanae TaxID=208358 RepID=A0ABV0W8T0_9TELE